MWIRWQDHGLERLILRPHILPIPLLWPILHPTHSSEPFYPESCHTDFIVFQCSAPRSINTQTYTGEGSIPSTEVPGMSKSIFADILHKGFFIRNDYFNILPLSWGLGRVSLSTVFVPKHTTTTKKQQPKTYVSLSLLPMSTFRC